MIWGIHFDIAGAMTEIEQLEAQSAQPDFWDDMENSQKVLQKTKFSNLSASGFHIQIFALQVIFLNLMQVKKFLKSALILR